MNNRFIFFQLLLILTISVCIADISPREAAMQIAIGGWGDTGDATIVKETNNGGLYSLRIHWKDDIKSDTPFWYMTWAAPIEAYDTLSADVLPESNINNASLPVYLLESDGDRWVAHIDVSSSEPKKWKHYSFSRDQFSFWGLGDNKPQWDKIASIVLEPSGKNAELVVYIDKLILSDGDKTKDLLDPANLPKSYMDASGKKFPLNTTDPTGAFIIAGGAPFWNNPENIKSLYALSPSVGVSTGGSLSKESSAAISNSLIKLNRPLMEEHQDGLGFEVELTEAGAWCVRWDGESNNKTPGKFDKGHSACISHPKFMEMNKRRADHILSSGINTLTLVDFVWPYWGGRWGYSQADIEAYRNALSGRDGGLKIADGDIIKTISFWDYFCDYSGYVMNPSDVGIVSWDEYIPATENEAWADNGPKRRNMFLFVTLTHYQWLKFLQELGMYMESKGGHLWMIPNPEDLANASDYIYASRLVGLQCFLPEYFGNPIWTEALYRSGGYLKQNAKAGNHLIGPIFETNAGGHGKPYYDPQISYAAAYDVCSSLNADVVKNDFLDEAPFSTISDPKNEYQYDRYRDTFSKVYAFDQYKLDKPVRRESKIAVVTPRNINRYKGSIFYGFGATDKTNDGSAADALSKEGFIFNLIDTIGFAPIEENNLIFWGVPEAPPDSVDRIRKWLLADKSNTLVCSAYQPARRVSGLGYCPWITDQDFIEDPNGGKPWGLPIIRKDNSFKSGKIDKVLSPFADSIKIGDNIDLPDGIWIAEGGKVLLSASGRPLVSEFKGPNGSKIIYLHYRSGEPQSLDIDRKVISAIAASYGAEKVSDKADETIVHSYDIDAGSVHVLWNRKSLNGWEFIYDGNRKQRLMYLDKNVNDTVPIPISRKGRYIIYDLFNDKKYFVNADEKIDLTLNGTTCAVYYVLRSGKNANTIIDNLRKSPVREFFNSNNLSNAP